MKRTNSAIAFGALSGLLVAPPTFSQDTLFFRDTAEFELGADLTFVPLIESDEADLVFDIDLRADYENITSNGRRYGWRAGLRAEQDRGRIAFGGRVGDCPSGQADCPSQPLRGYMSGLYSEGQEEADEGVRTAIHDAHLFVSSGWGEWRIGYGTGAAALDVAAGPAAFRTLGADGGELDPTGLNGARTLNLTSAYAPKLTFRSIALGQTRSIGMVRLSASFTPSVEDCGVDTCSHGTGPGGVRAAEPVNIVELGGLYELRRGEHEIGISFGWAQSDDDSGVAALEGVETSDFGLSWRNGAWLAGTRWLRSNNGIAGSGDYEALSASLGYEAGLWMTTIEWAGYSDDLVHSDGETWQIGTSRLGDHWLIGAGIAMSEREDARLTALGRRGETTDSTVIFLEASWRY